MKEVSMSSLAASACYVEKPTHARAGQQRSAYKSPVVVCYGTVANLTKNGGGSASDGTGNSMTITMGSDPCLKENVVCIGTHVLGIGLYVFDYKPEHRAAWGHGRQFGVMADEVELVMPEAVSVHPDGYKTVDYAMLGIKRHVH